MTKPMNTMLPTTTNSFRRWFLSGALACAAIGLCAISPARAEDPPKKPEAAKADAKPIVRLTAWPKPADKDQLLTDIERVCKAHTPEMSEQGRDAVIAAGAAAVPFVLERYGHERDEDVKKRLFEVLMGVTTAEQTRLLAKEFGNRMPTARTFALWRAAYFPDPEIVKDAEAAWARIAKLGEKADPEERYSAALCCASAGSIVGLEALWDATRTSKEWDAKKHELRAALNGARGHAATTLVLAKLDDKADRKVKVAVLRMLAGCGDKDSASRVRPFLDDEDNQVRVAAINALRGIVDGDPPLEDLSAFEAIEQAKKWKGR
jgi:HEAT repeat protein